MMLPPYQKSSPAPTMTATASSSCCHAMIAADVHNAFMSRLPFLGTWIHDSASLSGDPNANDITRYLVEVEVQVQGGVNLTLVGNHWKSGTADSDEFRRVVESLRITDALA